MNIKKEIPERETKGFYFGAPEAEGENVKGLSLSDYFEDYLGILSNIEIGKFIFTGRKGVGKSAIAKIIKDKSDESSDAFAKILRLGDFYTEQAIQSSDPNGNHISLLFEWLILVNLVDLIVSNECGVYTDEYRRLKKFLENNAGTVSVEKFQVEEGFKKSGGEVNFGVLTHAFGGIFKKYFDVKVTRAPFYKIIPPLRQIIKEVLKFPVNKNLKFRLLFDDMDINFDPKKDEDCLKIMELIRLAKNYNNEILSETNSKILVFLREDMKEILSTRYPDSAKVFTTYEIPIQWYVHNSASQDENKNPLKRLVNRRIELNFKRNNIGYSSDPWYDLFEGDIYNSNSSFYKTSFKYVLDFTFYRPRDIITFLTIIANNNYSFPIKSSQLKKILAQYITVNIKEIKSELSLHFTEQDKGVIFNKLFPEIIRWQGMSFNELCEQILALGLKVQPEKVIEILSAYSLIIYKSDDGNLFFNYRENPDLERLDKGKLSFTLPKCIFHHYNPIG